MVCPFWLPLLFAMLCCSVLLWRLLLFRFGLGCFTLPWRGCLLVCFRFCFAFCCGCGFVAGLFCASVVLVGRFVLGRLARFGWLWVALSVSCCVVLCLCCVLFRFVALRLGSVLAVLSRCVLCLCFVCFVRVGVVGDPRGLNRVLYCHT